MCQATPIQVTQIMPGVPQVPMPVSTLLIRPTLAVSAGSGLPPAQSVNMANLL